tara:strand:- start:248 stop:892 length:645 start_codon:yes stop_codon:yes gene_type:complete
MKKSELKEMIKASFLAEAEDSKKGNKEEQKRMEGAIRDDRDHIKNLEKDIKDNEAKLAKLKKDEPKDVSEEMKKDDVDEAMRGSYEEDDTMREAEEVDVEDNEDINVDIEDEVNIDDESEESKIEVDSELAGEDSDISAILGLLTKAQSNAKDLGDEKLMDQIGNTITYYTRTHVVAEDARTDAEEEGYKDGMKDEKEDLDESLSRFAKLAGLK